MAQQGFVAPSGTMPVRPGEELDVARISAILKERCPAFPGGQVSVYQFPAGASNLTYLVCSGEFRAVLRRPPFGPLPAKAHDMGRECRLLERLHPHFEFAPKPYFLVEDVEVLGAPFYVMEYISGLTLDAKLPTVLSASSDVAKDAGAQISNLFVQTLVSLHSVDIKASSLEEFGHPSGFLQRQVSAWANRYEQAKTEEIPEVAPLLEWLNESLPGERYVTLIHNDYKLNNLLFRPGHRISVAGVVDWEMATLGDPLLDLAVALVYWVEPGDAEPFHQWLPSVTSSGYFWNRDRLVAEYALRSGRDVSNLPYYQVFAYFKLAVILQQIYRRYRLGMTSDTRFRDFGRAVEFLIQHAFQLAQRAG